MKLLLPFALISSLLLSSCTDESKLPVSAALPRCEDEETSSTLKDAFNESQFARQLMLTAIEVTNVKTSQNSSELKRICSSTITMNNTEQVIVEYTLEPRKNQSYMLEFRVIDNSEDTSQAEPEETSATEEDSFRDYAKELDLLKGIEFLSEEQAYILASANTCGEIYEKKIVRANMDNDDLIDLVIILTTTAQCPPPGELTTGNAGEFHIAVFLGSSDNKFKFHSRDTLKLRGIEYDTIAKLDNNGVQFVALQLGPDDPNSNPSIRETAFINLSNDGVSQKYQAISKE